MDSGQAVAVLMMRQLEIRDESSQIFSSERTAIVSLRSLLVLWVECALICSALTGSRNCLFGGVWVRGALDAYGRSQVEVLP